jgi:hypothetical protein
MTLADNVKQADALSIGHVLPIARRITSLLKLPHVEIE